MKKPVFLGYAVFYKGKPFPSSGNTVTMNKFYLQYHALCKANIWLDIDFSAGGDWYSPNNVQLERVRKLWQSNRYLTLRRVYAH